MGYSSKGSMVKEHHHKLFKSLLVILCLIVGIVVVYIKVQNFDFVNFDDDVYVTENYYVQKGVSLAGFKWAFTTFHAANWHPLTWLSHMLDCELYGLSPAGHHWTNVVLHIANTVLLFLILFRMTGAIWRSAFVAALFALHPLHVESVAWVSERKDVLSTFFGLLGIAAYYGYVKKSSAKYYILVMALLSLSLMAKPMLVTLPFALLLLDFWPLKRFQDQRDFRFKSEKAYVDAVRRNHQIIIEKIPLFIVVAISCFLTFFAQKSVGAVRSLGALTLKYRIANAIVSYARYVLKAIWPDKLAVFYPHPGNTLPKWQFIGAALLIVAACYWAIRSAKKYPYIAVGLFWYVGTFVPVIGLVQVGDQAMADRYTYIPLIGIFIIISWGVTDLWQRWHGKEIFLKISATILLVALSWNTFIQLNSWENGITLFEHAVSVTKNNYSAHNNLATALVPIDLDRAIFHYKEALRIRPKYITALCNLGLTLYHKGKYEEATSYFTKALKIDPQKADARMNLANLLFLQSKPDDAISQYRRILQTYSENADVHYNLANVLSSQNKINEAVLHYNETLKIDPKHSKAYYHLGNILLNQGKAKEATALFFEAIKFNPDYVQAYNTLGCILFRKGKLNRAEVFFTKALQINPNDSEARTNLDILQNSRVSK